MDHKTLYEFERRLIPLRSIAGSNEALAKYQSTLPAMMPTQMQLISQGFDAGHAAAIAVVRDILRQLRRAASHSSE